MLKVVSKETHTLKPYERNARKHSEKQISKIASSMAQFGCNNPILIDKSDTMVIPPKLIGVGSRMLV